MYGSTILASVHFWSSEKYFWIADADAVKNVLCSKRTLKLSQAQTGSVTGPSPHRLLFNEENNALVWSETIRVVNEWFAHLPIVPTDGSDAEIDVCFIMTQATLIISSAGFGRSMHCHAVMSTTHKPYVKTLAPKFLVRILERFKSLRTLLVLDRICAMAQDYRDLRMHIVDMGSPEEKGELRGAALLKNLVEANLQEEGGGRGLTDDELLSLDTVDPRSPAAQQLADELGQRHLPILWRSVSH
ncbi:hypothetical protein FIBSPDRAFT_902675 [Athelia psychrophila]|uniref:Uncharacterized protein n=1 Tax=Athelia psychrophila TaxID=1759441 RepID=A0A167WXB7_9AGAM|nr:hypothetical protein FIBSPDRAFT_902675 [Fibularhizoctonia sp. CBS 109695]